jgi:hypothetical protein
MSKSLLMLLLGTVSPLLSIDVAAAKTPQFKAVVAKAPSSKATNTKTPSVAGTWKVLLSEEGKTATYIFNQKGNTLTGTMKGLPFGDLPIAGTISNEGKR